MAGFTDLVPQAQPALFGAGVSAQATEGRTWLWKFIELTDLTGTAIDLTGATATCAVLDRATGATVLALDFTIGAAGTFTIGKDEASTVALVTGDTARSCLWSLIVVKGGDSVQFWGLNSTFQIKPEGF